MSYNCQRVHLYQLLRGSFQEARRTLSTTPTPYIARPSTAPKPSINIKHIQKNPKLHSQNCLDRNYTVQHQIPFTIVELVKERQTLQSKNVGLRQKNNRLQTDLDHGSEASRDVVGNSEIRNEITEKSFVLARQLKDQIKQIEATEGQLNASIESLALELPNLTSSCTPIGASPCVLSYINPHLSSLLTSSTESSRNHVEIGNSLSLLDFASASTTSGWGFYYLKNAGSLLEQALIQYALHTAIRHKFTPVAPPTIVYSHISTACGFRPRDRNGEHQVYALQQPERKDPKPELSLAGTAEIPFAALHASTDMASSSLPLRIVGSSRCYRAEAGARGVDTKGLYRVHEFTKVEMFGWTAPTLSAATELFETMLSIQTEILTNLGLHCRILEMPSHDLGASAMRKQDIECFFPSRKERDEGWGEVTSTSICGDYQTRRLATRAKGKGVKTEFPWTVNGTALAVPRVLAAILERHWDAEEQCVRVPRVLWPWMGGTRVIRRQA
ncbi:MAG: hypothetical protein Q9187_002531 [Circinaria calcarea]